MFRNSVVLPSDIEDLIRDFSVQTPRKVEINVAVSAAEGKMRDLMRIAANVPKTKACSGYRTNPANL
jgi:hypothetical protein